MTASFPVRLLSRLVGRLGGESRWEWFGGSEWQSNVVHGVASSSRRTVGWPLSWWLTVKFLVRDEQKGERT